MKKKYSKNIFKNIAANKYIAVLERKRTIFFVIILLLITASLLLLGVLFGRKAVTDSRTSLRFGAIGDFEYGYRNNVGNKLTSRAPMELEKVVHAYNTEFFPTFVVELGDMVESSGVKPEKAKRQYQEINAVFSKLLARREYILGNHDLRALSKEEVRKELGLKDNHAYFDEGDWRFVLMDTNFDRSRNGADMGPNHFINGYVPEKEFVWLREAFKTEKPIVVFSHHPPTIGGNNVLNYKEVQKFFEQYPNVVLVISGHDPQFRFDTLNGISYFVADNLANADSLGSYATLETNYSHLTKEATVAIEHYGPTRKSVEAKKIISSDRKLWVDMLAFFNFL